ncbi:tryptophan--tRNA ligase, partial [bacterium]|nr:tryptophan--tRNA ligase [bacterium]
LVESECKAGKRGCADCKRQLAAKVNEHFKEIREKRKYYENHIDEVKDILAEGTEKSRAVSKKVLEDVRNIVGMY